MPKVLVPLAQGCEELEAVTIIDVLRRAEIEVITASLDSEMITASRDVKLIADMDLDTALQQDYDMCVLPGGLPGSDHLDNDSRIRELLIKLSNSEKFTAAICAAPKVLASAGLLNGKRATSYPGILDSMNVTDMEYVEDNVVKDGTVITSRGPGTAMEFALTLIETLVGKEKRNEVAKGLLKN